jgi:cytochrome c oxidase subunit 2
MTSYRVPRSLLAAASLVLTGLSLSSAPAGARADRARPVQAGEPRVIEITASRFAFEPATVDVAVGERVRLVLTSADGVHGLEIKKFKVKKEIPRGGTPVEVDFTATAEGRFPILCSEFCGDGHEEMTGTLVVRALGESTP